MSVDVLPVAAPGAPAFITTPELASSDERWAAWQAKGAAHDRALRRRTAVAAPILIFVVAVMVYALFGQ